MTSIRALLLDADGVVQLPAPSWRSSAMALCADSGRADEFLGEIFAAERPCLSGELDFGDALRGVLHRWNSASSVEEALRVWTLIDADSGVLELISELRATGLRVALATNQQQHRARYMTAELGYLDRFDHLLYSCRLGHAKPTPGYFVAALDVLGVPAHRVLFVDDHPENVDAARRCGLHAETFHLCEGIDRLRDVLASYGIRTGPGTGS